MADVTNLPGPVDLPLFERWMDLTRWLLQTTSNFPKRLRMSLTTRIESLAIEILEGLVTAAYSRDKVPVLESCNLALTRLRVLLRLAHEMEILSHGAYERSARGMQEAGRMLGGWMKHAATRRGDDG